MAEIQLRLHVEGNCLQALRFGNELTLAHDRQQK